MKKANISVVLILMSSFIISSCGFPEWSKKMGSKLPTYGGAESRCDDWFCFGDKKSKKTKSTVDSKRRLLYSNKQVKPSNTARPVVAPVVIGDKKSKRLSGNSASKDYSGISDEDLYAAIPPKPPKMAVPPGAPSELPVQREPVQPKGPVNDDDMAFDPNFDPELYRPNNLKDKQNIQNKRFENELKAAGMKSHEINPKWKEELPEGPLGTVRKGVGW